MRHALFRGSLGGLVLAAVAGSAAPVAAQPWGTFFKPVPLGTHGYVEVPHHADLNPVHGFTFEAWFIDTSDPPTDDCASLAGKNWRRSWWVGTCGFGGFRYLRSYLRGEPEGLDAGLIPVGWWTHVAVTFDGTRRRHFVNGELVGETIHSGPLTSPDTLRIFSDTQWAFSPDGFIREVRLWRVARSLAQIRGSIDKRITTPQAGLVAVWPLEGDSRDALGRHHGTVRGSGGFASYLPAATCYRDPGVLCLADRFQVRVRWQHPGGRGGGSVVPGFSDDSGLFWFFRPENWELLVKTVDGCAVNDRRWIFYAPVTDVHYDLEVFDRIAAKIRVFFGYQGATQGATDTDAFDTCP